jgi:ribonuclease P/MRP protein subunit POP5
MNIKKRQKLLLPSLREKKRYLAFEIVSDSKIDDFHAVSGRIMHSSLSFLGELETAKSGIIIMEDRWNHAKQRGILKVSNKHLKGVMASLALIDSIEGKEAMFRSLGVSGAVNKAARFI